MASSKRDGETDDCPGEAPTKDPAPAHGPQGPANPVALQRTSIDPTADQALWVLIRQASQSIAWEPYAHFLDQVMRDHVWGSEQRPIDERRSQLPFPGVDFYALLKAGTEVFLMASCGITPVTPELERLSAQRGFSLHDDAGQAVPRGGFLEAFHDLLHQCAKFYREDDDTTRTADGLSVLDRLRDVHVLLSEGGHNQYGDLPWNARLERMMRDAVDRHTTVEPRTDRGDTMKTLHGWSDTGVTHLRDLGVSGGQIALSARFGGWDTTAGPQQAAEWARYWRAEIQGYIRAYREATGVDLGAVPPPAG
jgi:hypothetical protein